MARVPFDPVPQAQAQTEPTPYERVDTSPFEFGGGIAEGMARAGQGGMQASQAGMGAAIKYADLANETAVNTNYSAFGDYVGQQTQWLRSQRGSHAGPAFQQFQQNLRNKLNELAGNLASPLARQQFVQEGTRSLAYTMRSAGSYVGEQTVAANLQSNVGRIQTATNLAVTHANDPQAVDGYVQDVTNATLSYAHLMGFDAKTADALVTKNVGNVLHSVVSAYLAQGATPEQQAASIRQAQAFLARYRNQTVPGSPGVPMLDAQQLDQLDATIQSRLYTNAIRQEEETNHAQIAAMKAQRDAENAAGGGYVQMIYSGKMPGNILSQISADPRLGWRSKAALIDMVKAHDRGLEGHDAGTYGPGIYDVIQRVNAAQGDPSRITTPQELWGMAGPNGQLTVAGVKLATGILEQRGTVQGAATNKMLQQFLKNAREQITGTNPVTGARDPKGDEEFLKFQGAFWPAYEKGIQAGLTPEQLLDPTSKDYAGKIIPHFVRPAAEWTRDMLEDYGGPVPNPTAPQNVAPEKMSKAQLIAAVQNGEVSRALGEQIALKNGWIAAQAQAAGPQVPVAP